MQPFFMALFEYINGLYNPRRPHAALGWKSPVAFERKWLKRALGAARIRDRTIEVPMTGRLGLRNN
jgi:hypothetical protein